ncbi:MAG: efflux RND transporter periplasmic adaptor subunit [Pseudomonadota bacterium]
MKTPAAAFVFAMITATAPTGALAQDDATLTSRGIVQSAARIELRADLTAMVTKADFIDGTRFKKGDTLVSFDCRRHQAELNSARAAARGAAVERRNKSSLYSNGAAGKSELLIAKAASNKAEFDVKALKARMQNCTISAPFDGRMVSLNVRPMEMPPADKPLMVIIDDSRLELELVVPSHWLAWLRKGQNFRFNVEETGATHQATVQRIGAEVDPVSQTVKIYAALEGELQNTLSGMTGVAVFQQKGS